MFTFLNSIYLGSFTCVILKTLIYLLDIKDGILLEDFSIDGFILYLVLIGIVLFFRFKLKWVGNVEYKDGKRIS